MVFRKIEQRFERGKKKNREKKTTRTRFERARAEPNALAYMMRLVVVGGEYIRIEHTGHRLETD